MKFTSINPYTNTPLKSYPAHTKKERTEILEKAQAAFTDWRTVSIESRATLMYQAAEVLRKNKDTYAKMMSLEMGKPITEAWAEVEKCAWVCEYYAEHTASFLADESIKTDARKSFVRHEPLGVILAIMPWNYPFWQVFRNAAPTLMAGNVCVLKHASNVSGSALLIAEVFREAGFPSHCFQNLLMHHKDMEEVIAHEAVKAISLTGSEKAGSSAAAFAGKYIKKSLLELGGSNTFMVWADADLEEAVQTAVNARMLNTGQSCIAAKRFIIMEEVYEAFVEKFIAALTKLKGGDPLDEDTAVGPLARKDLADTLHEQMEKSVAMGAKLLYGGEQEGCYHQPTVLGEVSPGMPAFDEETFGPLACMTKAKNLEEAFALAEQSKFGLGITVCTRDVEKALTYAHRVSDGAYFINELVKSDPRLPFGGTKASGYGRELSRDGILEFVNRKTVYVK
jgi:succinate-semialdehyde dehydrogenase/glutarate-semialdehyde dehydrogenase